MDPFVAITPNNTDNQQSAAEAASPNTNETNPFVDITPSNNNAGNGEILQIPTQVTQSAGTYNPIEPTQGHIAADTNFSASENTPVYLPPGNWQVVKSYNGANPQGAPGDYSDNQGYGNDIWVKDQETGQMLHFLHLASVDAQVGASLPQGAVVGTTGSSGNATGPNLGVEYYNGDGQLGDIMKSPFATYLPVNGAGDGGSGGGLPPIDSFEEDN